ncbi:MAG: malectin domain-containing carbohydrate-binding protein [Pricia sp.]
MKRSPLAQCRLMLTLMLVSLLSTIASAQQNQYDVMEVVEVAFNSQNQYDNAYMDVDVWVELKKSGSSTEVYRVPVFWDGGTTFRVRLVATSPGSWSWRIMNETVDNADQGFLNRNGSFTATAADVSSNSNNRGFIQVDPNTKRTLQYADGTPFFYTADTSWSALTAVFGYEQANAISGISFKDYIRARKRQGFNGLNVIASFPDDTYLQQQGRNLDRPGTQTGLWASETWGKKTGPNGVTPFAMKRRGQPVTDDTQEVDYKRIVPEYWQSVDQRMQFLADEGFVTLFESIRRHERWVFRPQDEKNAFYNYIRYLWARYGCYNMIFSWVHHDTNSGNVYPGWRALVQDAHSKLSAQLGNRMPYGQPRTAMSYNTTLNNWERDIPGALDVQNVSNAERDETMHQWLRDIYGYSRSTKPALNLEPFYPGWGLHSQNEINAGLDDATMAQMQMYGSVLSGGLAGHAWGDAYYAGAATATGRSRAEGGTIVPNNDPQVKALNRFESQAMGHLKSFILDSGHDYRRLKPAAHTNLSDNKGFIHTLSISDDKKLALGFFTADSRSNPTSLPTLTNLRASETYSFQWWDVTNGGWISAGEVKTNSTGRLQTPALPNNDRTKSWAYRLRSDENVVVEEKPETDTDTNNNFALRINSGGERVTYNGNTFSADNYSDTGRTLDRPQTGLDDPFKTFRYSPSQVMGYAIPVDNGEYTVKLHFAELWFGATSGGSGGQGSRVFDVRMEGDLVENNLDVFAQVGAQTTLTKTYAVEVTDGTLEIDFSALGSDGGTRHPIINAIEILGAEEVEESSEDTETPVTAVSVGHWRLDDSSGLRATDASGNQYHGTLTGGIDFRNNSVDGAVQDALDFSGADDFVNLPDIDKSVDNEFTLSAWIKPERTTGDYQGIAGTHTAKGFMAFVHEGSLAFSLRTDKGRKLLNHGTLVANRWQHIAVSYDGNTMTWFINGDKVGSEAHSGQVSDNNAGYIGWSGWSTEFFDGGIDDVRLFSNALSEKQVSDLVEEGTIGTTSKSLAVKARLSTEGTGNLTTENVKAQYVHPNPTTARFKITGTSPGTKEIMVSDFSSRTLISMQTDQDEPELDLSAYPNGIYAVKVLQSGTVHTFKVIKK